MNCEEVQELLNPLFDNHLTSDEVDIVQAHLNDCTECLLKFNEIEVLHHTLCASGRFKAPASLTENIFERLDLHDHAQERKIQKSNWTWPIVSHSVAAILGAIVVFFSTSYLSNTLDISDDMVTLHVQALTNNNLAQIKSADTHHIKPWFARKLAFSPPVLNLEAQGFPLAGGRIDILNHRKIAALIYKRRKHIINLFIDTYSSHIKYEHKQWQRNGYNVAHIRHGDFLYWAVSDIKTAELEEFLLRLENSLKKSDTS